MAVPSLRTPWKRRQVERAERKAMKQDEKELREEAERQKQVKIFMTEIISFLRFWVSKQHLFTCSMQCLSLVPRPPPT